MWVKIIDTMTQVTYECTLAGLINSAIPANVDHKVVIPSTGMHDASGRRIYKHDLIVWPHLSDDSIHRIEWVLEECCYIGKNLSADNDRNDSWLDHYCLVIGNEYIDGDRELLKKDFHIHNAQRLKGRIARIISMKAATIVPQLKGHLKKDHWLWEEYDEYGQYKRNMMEGMG